MPSKFANRSKLVLKTVDEFLKQKPQDPVTREEWQTAADVSSFLLLLDSAEKYGLVDGPRVNVERAEDLLNRAKAMGIYPAGFEKLVKRFIG